MEQNSSHCQNKKVSGALQGSEFVSHGEEGGNRVFFIAYVSL
jgi:hypothetical protein